ncbi:site-specific DNA-methyltransferase [Corynebacterium urinipleomorphum]|uniref:site-specific DNA-methyltransferase n=1 Tax=Corynebacterium urinipleomorphum TaxID=1852380 RepID=UPI000B353F4B|nr:DNA methyltransferase [Corynebacterium urinipleomorphum]
MSRLTDLLAQAKGFDPKFAAELEKEIRHSQNQRSFGLVFERHLPDAVELPTRPVRRGDTVHILPPRGTAAPTDPTLWTVAKIDRTAEGGATAVVVETKPAEGVEPEVRDGVAVDDLVVVAQHDDTIYPGLVQTGEVVNSDDPQAPFHTVINAENLHALNLLTYTHRHKVDCIYIDPPYNTRDKDWKYNNDYVDGDDQYKHSKWLSMMEKRLELAKELLNPEDSVLIVTIDEKEYLRLGMLLEQTFPEATIQMVSSLINRKGVARGKSFRRVDEYVYFCWMGSAGAASVDLEKLWPKDCDCAKKKRTSRKNTRKGPDWTSMMRRGSNSLRSDRENLFYPIYVDPQRQEVVTYGPPIPDGEHEAPQMEGLVAVLPLRTNGEEGNWQCEGPEMMRRKGQGRIRVGSPTSYGFVINYLPKGAYAAVLSDAFEIEGFAPDGSLVAYRADGSNNQSIPPTQWSARSHNSSEYGTGLVKDVLGGKRFTYPKSLYAVEDTLRFYLQEKPNATVLDFFSGSGTTAHAVMRLNKQDGGKRRSISVTNNEVSFEEAKKLTKEGFRPGDPEWERLGICDYVTKPRIEAAITGKTPAGDPIKGDYKFTDEFPMSDGFEANARFFTLTYEPPTRVRHGLAFKQIAPLLWMRAGQFGRVIESIPDRGWDVAESHGVIKNIAATDAFAEAVREAGTVTTIYVVADDDLMFQSAVAKLSDFDVEFVQLYSTYLTNFAFTQSGGAI